MNYSETVQTFIEEVINRGNLHAIQEVVHPNYHYTSPTETMEGAAALEAFIQALRIAFPDLKVTILKQFESEETVCTRIRFTGTHLGEFLDMPATNRAVNVEGCIISQFRDGLIAEEWEILDQLSLLQQLGAAA